MTYHYQDYLSFNEEDDKQNQILHFDAVKLSDHTLQQLTKLNNEVHWLVMAEPFCPDCVTFIPVLEKMRQANPLIHIHFVPRYQLQDETKFNSATLHQLVKDTHSIPSLYDIKQERLLFAEFPEHLKQQILENENIKEDYRQGKYQAEIEKTLLALLLN